MDIIIILLCFLYVGWVKKYRPNVWEKIMERHFYYNNKEIKEQFEISINALDLEYAEEMLVWYFTHFFS